jgi:hypothetical protein
VTSVQDQVGNALWVSDGVLDSRRDVSRRAEKNKSVQIGRSDYGLEVVSQSVE